MNLVLERDTDFVGSRFGDRTKDMLDAVDSAARGIGTLFEAVGICREQVQVEVVEAAIAKRLAPIELTILIGIF